MALPATYTFPNDTGDLATDYPALWTRVTAAPTKVVSGVATITASAGESQLAWAADTFGNDHYSQAVLTTVPSNGNNSAGVIARTQGTSGGNTLRGYAFAVSNNTYYVVRYLNGAFDSILATGAVTPSTGDTLKIAVSGSTTVTITCSRKPSGGGFETIATYADSSANRTASGGSAGIYLNSSGSGVGAIDTWEGGDVSAASSIAPLASYYARMRA